MTTSKHALIEAHLKGRSLGALVAARRRSGHGWQAIANEVHRLTGVAVSREALRSWFPENPAATKRQQLSA